MREQLWPLFDRSAWAQPAPLLAKKQMKALLGSLFSLSAWAQIATVVADTTGVGVAVASVRSFGMGSVSNALSSVRLVVVGSARLYEDIHDS